MWGTSRPPPARAWSVPLAALTGLWLALFNLVWDGHCAREGLAQLDHLVRRLRAPASPLTTHAGGGAAAVDVRARA